MTTAFYDIFSSHFALNFYFVILNIFSHSVPMLPKCLPRRGVYNKGRKRFSFIICVDSLP